MNILAENERIIWQGKPHKRAYCLNKFIRTLPLAIIWLCVDVFFIVMLITSGVFKQMWYFLVPFFAIHLIPIWKTIADILMAGKRWEKEAYIATDKRILISSGLIGTDFQSLYYKDIRNVRLNVGLIDKMFNVGDIYFESNSNIDVLAKRVNIKNNNQNSQNTNTFLDVENPYELYTKLQKIVLDLQTDVFYPNALRPDENKGYNTQYNNTNIF